MENFYAERGEFAAVELAAGADEIIHADNLQAGRGCQQRPRERAADEAADAGN